MKTILKITLLLFVLNAFQSCSKDDAPTPEPIAKPEPEPIPEPEPENQAPTQVSLLSPAVDAENIDVRPTFSWEAATDSDGDAITYEIYADTTATPSSLIGTTSETSFELEERLGLLESYNWRVVAKDGKEGESESKTESFDTRTIITSNATTSAEFGRKYGHSSAVFNNKIWVIGGFTLDNNQGFDDVWASENGIDWNLITASANFGPIAQHKSFAFQNKLWVLGGFARNEVLKNELWNSEDGISWNLVNQDMTFTRISDADIVLFDNKLWLIGDEVWFSEDGIVWSLANDTFSLEGVAAVYNDKIWVIGDIGKVKMSDDGFNWTTLETNTDATFQALFDTERHHVFQFNNKLWAMSDGNISLYSSTDGMNWRLISDTTGTPTLSVYSNEIFQDKIWLLGGLGTGTNNFQDDVWFLN